MLWLFIGHGIAGRGLEILFVNHPMKYYISNTPVVLLVSGPDAPRYLNARLTNDFKSLAVGQSQLSAALTAQGKTEAFFTVYKKAQDSAILYSLEGDNEEIEEAFCRFKVADQVEVENVSKTYGVAHVCEVIESSDDIISIPVNRVGSLGLDLVGPKEKLSELASELLTREQFEEQRIIAGTPSFPQEINSNYLFMESGFGEQAVSFSKGCYIGQEVIEKVDARGRLPYVLEHLVLEDSDTIETEKIVCLLYTSPSPRD